MIYHKNHNQHKNMNIKQKNVKVNFNKIHLSSRLLQQHNWSVVSNTCLFPITYGIIHQLLTNSYFSRWLKVKPPTRHSVVNQWSNYIKLQFWFVFTSPIFYNNTIIRSRHGESPASFAETQVDEGFPETALPTQGTDSRWETVEKSPTSGTGSMELGRIFQSLLPSGNLLHSYWTWPIYSGFTHEKWLFSIVMLVYRSLLCFFFPVNMVNLTEKMPWISQSTLPSFSMKSSFVED